MSDIPWWLWAITGGGVLTLLVLALWIRIRLRLSKRKMLEMLDYWLADQDDEIDRRAEYFRLWEAKRHAECVTALDRVIARERARVERETHAAS
jgi:hypothetical protein